ncbi:hypothetical protein BaRGS_00035926 [Batillaria attramentaria]|uniref:Uncharacterized protein n=1 Tax=Batillaria attramentaria TaxID=370345 RepID=A0ABD0JD88_9CAEN
MTINFVTHGACRLKSSLGGFPSGQKSSSTSLLVQWDRQAQTTQHKALTVRTDYVRAKVLCLQPIEAWSLPNRMQQRTVARIIDLASSSSN